MMAVGTGTTTAVSSLSQVGRDTTSILHPKTPGFTVVYRSKDANLPHASEENGPGGEVYFDVRIKGPSSLCEFE